MWLQRDTCQILKRKDTPDKITVMIIVTIMIKEINKNNYEKWKS